MKILNEQGRSFDFPEGISILDILSSEKFKNGLAPNEREHIIAARMDYAPVSLATRIDCPARIHPITLTTVEGRRIYQKSLVLVLLAAFRKVFPEGRLLSLHSISKGIYHTADLDRPLTREDTAVLKREMQDIIDRDMVFEEFEMERQDAIAHFRSTGADDKTVLLETVPPGPVPLVRLGELTDLRLIPAVPSTGFLKVFDLVFHHPGLILRFPRTGDPAALPPYTDQKGLFRIFTENREWAEILEIHNTGELNRAVLDNRHGEIIKLAEALHEKKIASIADRIAVEGSTRKFILIAGPSSSGKTTFSKRLAVQLRVNGIRSTPISTDDYFRNREDTPRDRDGNYNFEDLEALDLDLFNRHLRALLRGEPVTVPNFSFELGRAKESGHPLHIPEEEPVIIEGIHCLNPELTASVPRENKFLIYVSALTQINIDNSNRIPTTDNRILRRIVRDSLFRGYSAYETISRWPSVRSGEDRNIFPYQDEADAMFNSALIYELGVLRDHALPHLRRVPHTVPEYSEAARLIAYLESFLSIPINEIPPTSILREFIGESAFQY